MENKDAHVQKILAELGLKQEPKLTPEQEELLRRALDPEEQFLHDIKRIFTTPTLD